jgi:hypothetical protein
MGHGLEMAHPWCSFVFLRSLEVCATASRCSTILTNDVKQGGHTTGVVLCSNSVELPEDSGAAWRIHRLQQGPSCDKIHISFPFSAQYNTCLYISPTNTKSQLSIISTCSTPRTAAQIPNVEPHSNLL